MYGLIFKIEIDEATLNLKVFASYGGLMMLITGHVDNFSKYFKNDERIFFLIK